MKTKKGFTLIELLVVIAIIAILAAILFPVFAKARDKARGSACLSNEKQLGMALMMYVDDWNETFFKFWYTGNSLQPATVISSWPEFLVPYIKSMGLFACPSSEAEPKTGFPYVCNYAGNLNFGYSELISMSMVTAPASTLFFYEDTHEVWWCYTNQANYTCLWTKGLIATWHNEGSNILMADGHAKWMKTSVLTTYAMGDTGTNVLYEWQGITWLPYPTFQKIIP